MIRTFLDGFNDAFVILESIVGEPLTPHKIPLLLIVVLFLMAYYYHKHRSDHSLKKLTKLENESKSIVFNDESINKAYQLDTEKRKFEMMSLVNYSEKDNFMTLFEFLKPKYTIRFLGFHYRYLEVDWKKNTIKIKRNAWAWYEMIAFTLMALMMLVLAFIAFVNGKTISMVICILGSFGIFLMNTTFFFPVNIKKEFENRVKLKNDSTKE